MKIQRAFRQIAVFSTLTLLIAALSGIAIADEVPAFSRRLPDSVAAHVSIPDAGVLRKRLPNCSWGRLLNDPLVADFRKNLVNQIQAFVHESVQLPDGVSAEDLLNLDVGEITLTVLNPVDGKLPIVFSVDAASADETVSALVRQFVEGSVKDGWIRSSVEHADTTVTVLTRAADAGDDRSASIRAVFLRDGHLVVANSVDAVKRVLDRWSGNVQGAFDSNATLGKVRRITVKPDRAPALFWYVDPVGATISLLSHGAASNATTKLTLSRLPKLGLTSFRGMGGTIDFATGTHDTVTRIAGVVRQPVRAAMAIVQFPATDLTPPAWVPDDIDSCMLLNWDVGAAYAGLEEMAEEFLGPGGLANAIEVLSTKTDPPIHVKNDIVNGLSGKVMILQSNSKKNAGEGGATLMAVSITDPQKFQRMLRQLIDQPESKAGSRTVGTTTIVVLDGQRSKSTQLTVARGMLLIGNDAALLDSVISSDAGGHLVDSAQFQRLSANIPAAKSLFSIQRPVNQLEVAYEMLKQGGVAVPEGVDLKLLPTFDRIQHHFLPTATWAAPTADGFQYVSFSLPPNE